MSDFQISGAQRRRLKAGNYAPLEFDTKPYGCEPGARYVLAWKKASVAVLDRDTGECAVTPAHPTWFLTVTSVRRRRKGMVLVWEVRFEVTDRRDPDMFLKPGGGLLAGRDPLDAGRVPDEEWLDRHTDAIASFWTRTRFERHREAVRERDRARRLRRAA